MSCEVQLPEALRNVGARGDVAAIYTASQKYQNGYGPVYEADAHLKAEYVSGAPGFANYRFVQIIYTVPTNGSPYIDPGDPKHTPPFYYTPAEDLEAHNGDDYTFTDYPSRQYDGTQALGWGGALFLTYLDPNSGALTIEDGILWGFYTVGEIGSGGTNVAGRFGNGASPVPELPGWAVLSIGALFGRRFGRRRP